MIPTNTPIGTPIAHTRRDGLRRFGHTTSHVYEDAARCLRVRIRLEDGTDLHPVVNHPKVDPVELAGPIDLDPPQLALFEME